MTSGAIDAPDRCARRLGLLLSIASALACSAAHRASAAPPPVSVAPAGCGALGIRESELADLLAAELGPSDPQAATDGDVPSSATAPTPGGAATVVAVTVSCVPPREMADVTVKRAPSPLSTRFEVQLGDLSPALRPRALALRIADELRVPVSAEVPAGPAPPAPAVPAAAPVARAGAAATPPLTLSAAPTPATPARSPALSPAGAPSSDRGKPSSRGHAIAGGLAIGMGALGLIGVGTGGVILGGRDDEDRHGPESTRRKAGIALVSTGGALVLGAAISTVVWARTAPAHGLSVGVIPIGGGALATVGARF